MNTIFAFRGVVFLGECVLMASVILLTAWWIAIRAQRNATMRHLTWLIAFLSLLLTPALVAVVPTRFVVQVPIAVTSSPSSTAEDIPVAGALRAAGISPAGAPEPLSREMRLATLLLEFWLAGVGAIGIVGAVAAYEISRIRRHSVRYTLDSLDLAELSAKVGLTRNWELRVSSTANPPAAMTWGFLLPVILLPKDSAFWSKNRLEAVLLHELAHVRRYDNLSQWLAFTVCALYWFHPAVWRCARVMRAEAELAADDAVLVSGVKPSAYAAELLRFAAELGQRRPQFAYPGVSFMGQSRIESRIESILNADHPKREVTSMQALKALALGFSAVLFLALLRPSVSLAVEQRVARVASIEAVPSPGTTKVGLPLNPEARAVGDHKPTQRGAAKNSGAKVCRKTEARKRLKLKAEHSSATSAEPSSGPMALERNNPPKQDRQTSLN